MKKQTIEALALTLCLATTFSLFACSTKDNSNLESSVLDSSTPTVTYTVSAETASLDSSYNISDTLYGIFVEDINFAIDGGLYTELIKNRSFEYGSAAANENHHGWINSNKDVLDFNIINGSENQTYLNENNHTYATLANTSSTYEGIGNKGYLDGMAITENETYVSSLYLKSSTGYPYSVRISLESVDGTVYAEDFISGLTDTWQKYQVSLTPEETISKNLLFSVKILSGSIDIDMISLMPSTTYHNLHIRRDIGEYLEALNPSFLRFPGGCVIEGKDEESIYSWKDSIGNGLAFTVNGQKTVGDISVRPQGKSIWSGNKINPYYTTYGIGFFEYFQLCEALDALPIPVLNAGMTCEVQSPNYIVYPLDSEEFKKCIQDALDLVEFCLGDENTHWGNIRIAMGHEEPFNLTYIGIGNEQWQREYHAHFKAFVKAFEDAKSENPALYSKIKLIIANGTSSGSTEGWAYIEENPDRITTLVDEHYYETPNWFLTNTNRYDGYDRNTKATVFLGEYAAQSNTLEAALAEAAFMTGLERNSDIVTLACYAPLLGNNKFNQWTPDLIYFSNNSLFASINYYVQQMFSNNVGTTILPSALELPPSEHSNDFSGHVGLGTWKTSVAYDNLKITSNTTSEILYSTDFDNDTILKDDNWNIYEGEWSIEDGRLVQAHTGEPFDTNTGDVIYVGDPGWDNYTLTVDAEILRGDEGFLIPICVENTSTNIFWNIGGWGNTVSCLQIVSNNNKSGPVTGTVKNLNLNKNQVYGLKVVVDGLNIKCYINDILYINYFKETPSILYESSSIDKNGDLIIKFVNVSDQSIDISTSISGIDLSSYEKEAFVTTLSGDKLSMTNSYNKENQILPETNEIPISNTFTYIAPNYSISIIRILSK